MSWFRKKQTVKPSHPRILFDINPEGLQVTVEWPELSQLTVEQNTLHGNNLASTISAIGSGDGRVFARLQAAVGTAGKLSEYETFAEFVLGLLNEQMTTAGRQEADQEGPLIKPSEAFEVRNHDNG